MTLCYRCGKEHDGVKHLCIDCKAEMQVTELIKRQGTTKFQIMDDYVKKHRQKNKNPVKMLDCIMEIIATFIGFIMM
jgi:NMD protein affecting ribosome stability and mRNA decay